MIRRMALVGLPVALLLSGCDLFMNIKRARAFVEEATFPAPSQCTDQSDGPASADEPHRAMFTALMPPLVVGFDHPVAAARCLRELLGKYPEQPAAFARSLWTLGSCRAQQPINAWTGFRRCTLDTLGVPGVSFLLPVAADAPPRLACDGLEAADSELLVEALGNAADALYAHRRGIAPDEVTAFQGDGGVFVAAEQVLGDAAALLAEDPTGSPDAGTRRGHYPALAMSGGAANGAFTAGYVFALLDLRERAIAALWKEAEAQGKRPEASEPLATILRDERFGAITGTSVGALVALPADLYFADTATDPKRLAAQLQAASPALLGCAGDSGPLARRRPAQACALSLLRTTFTRYQESQFLCANDVGAGDLFGKCANALMSFDPMESKLIAPFFRDYGGLVTGNDVVREAVAVEGRRAHLVALDERACGQAGPPGTPALAEHVACLTSAVMASIDEPIYATRQPWVTAAPGQRWYGFWLDGGLQSGTPALRGLSLTRWPLPSALQDASRQTPALRVLAVNTNRLEAGTSAPVQGLFPLIASSFGLMANQMRFWEQGALAPEAAYRAKVACSVGITGACAQEPKHGYAAAPEPLSRQSLNWTVWQPESLVPPTLAADAYQFDPQVMTGLFVLGEVTFYQGGVDPLLAQLGWNQVRAWATRGHSRELKALAADASRRLERFNAFAGSGDAQQRYLERRKRTFDQCFRTCGSVSGDALCSEDILASDVSALGGTSSQHLSDLRPTAFFEAPRTLP